MAAAHDWLTGTQNLASLASLLCLQAAALEGLLAVALLMGRHFGWPMHRRGSYLGLMLGLTGFVLAWFVSDYMQGAIKPNLALDVLYLGGLLGGWPGGLIVLSSMVLSRWHFGGLWVWHAVLIDFLVPVAAGVWLRHVRFPKGFRTLSVGVVLQVWLVRAAATVVGTVAGALAPDLSHANGVQLVQLRLGLVVLSLPLLALALLLVRSDAQIDEHQQREYRQARTDPLTGMPNRKALSERIRRHWAEHMVQPACLAVVELANPQAFLSRYGLDQGEHLWRHWLQAKEREWRDDVLTTLSQYAPWFYQYGDFSLAIFLDGATLDALEQARPLDTLLTLATRDLRRCWPEFEPTLRCAVVDMSRDAHVGDHPIPYRNITLALSSLTVGVAYFNESLREDVELDHYIEAQWARWDDPEQVPLWLQPKVRLTDRTVTGAEALLRLHDADGRPVSAMRVVTLLRRLGKLADFEWRTIVAVVHVLHAHAAQLSPVTLAVNVSGESLRREGFADAVRALLDRAAVPRDRLQLEVVEWAEVAQGSQVHRNLEDLTRHGIPVAIDDFGIGYSNLLLLMRLPFQELKIDNSLVSSLADGKSRTVVQLIIEMAHQNGATVVAEGIETPAMEAQVRALGADQGQGYLYTRALPVQAFLTYLAA